jgi:hypothetical protein
MKMYPVSKKCPAGTLDNFGRRLIIDLPSTACKAMGSSP